ncbi:phage portal protein [Clostridiisalibacter paucivorans]|uniref:phage portal protein n=1 Tax=Clostridiisalibacter paucivorans TaxID=408753 RepID=UPI000AB43A6E|nr:phage portal protein [Clostridiisalibacter paucivorans]
MINISSEMSKIKDIITRAASKRMTEKQFIEVEIKKWESSINRKNMITGEKYYKGDHDILQRQRTMVGQDGMLQVVYNLPNNKIIDNQYAKMVDQKKNYLLSKPLTFDTENNQYEAALKKVLNKRFQRTLKNLGEDSLNGGIGWLHPYYNDLGEFCFKRFQPYEILPFWKDAEHTELDFAVRLYEIEAYEGAKEKTIKKVEVYSLNGIDRYVLEGNMLIPDIENPSSNYFSFTDGEGEVVELNWERIPLIAFKYNAKEIPLITRVKSLQDGINIMLSDFENNMQEDARNTILVIENYDGANLAEFRHNLATYGAVKVKSIDGAKGGVSTLTVEVNADNYKAIVEIFKKALIENARGYDAKDERMSGTPNQMNIQSMYNDIDLDANEMETEYQASFEELLWFVNTHLNLSGIGNFFNESVEVIFNRDMMMNESTVIDNLAKSVGILSNETIISQHPG